VRARLRVPRLEKSAAREAHQEKQNLQAAEPEKSGAREPDRGKQNPRAVALNFRESPPPRQLGNLHLKQPVPVNKPRKGHKHAPIGSRKDPRLRHRHRDLKQ
jgi:hypothetical protein